jgi:hypothetical protein
LAEPVELVAKPVAMVVLPKPVATIRESLIVANPTVKQSLTVARSTSSRLKTTGELAASIQASQTNRVYARMGGRQTDVYLHLVRDHGYTSAQVNGLTINDALMLHNLAHGPAISAYTQATLAATYAPAALQPKPVAAIVQASTGCANGRCARRATATQPVRYGLFGWRRK